MDDPIALVSKVLKVAKKSLKRQDSSMKLKALAKIVAGKLNESLENDASVVNQKKVKKLIKKSKKFTVRGKDVSLARKRNMDETSSVPGVNQRPLKKPREIDGENAPLNEAFFSVETWRKENKIVVKHAKDDDEGKKETARLAKDSIYFPFVSFDNCKSVLGEKLIRHCTEINKFQKPSPIQAQSWPILLHKKRDVVGIAETGSGKTLAFGIPALYIMSQNSKRSKRLPRMLVLSPTRELAMQVEAVLKEYGSIVGLNTLVLYGGVPKYMQVAELKKGNVDCIVATPGRIKDLINDGSCVLREVHHLVLDEADRMLDMGFEEDVKFIISSCASREDGRQTAMFSATWPAAIQEIAINYMVDPVRIYVGFEAIVGSNGENSVDDSLSANKRVKQIVEVIEDRQRENRLRELLRQYKTSKQRILIFALYKKEAERLEFSLKRDGFNVCSIHGNKNQASRTEALSQFKSGTCQMMVATDVAARGLDIPEVEAVVNYTFPLTIEDYIHRIGRTARAGKSGVSHTFFQPSDKSHAGELQQVMKQAEQVPPEALMKFGSTIKKKEHKLYGNFGPKGSLPMKKATKITFNYSDD